MSINMLETSDYMETKKTFEFTPLFLNVDVNVLSLCFVAQ